MNVKRKAPRAGKRRIPTLAFDGYEIEVFTSCGYVDVNIIGPITETREEDKWKIYLADRPRQARKLAALLMKAADEAGARRAR